MNDKLFDLTDKYDKKKQLDDTKNNLNTVNQDKKPLKSVHFHKRSIT